MKVSCQENEKTMKTVDYVDLEKFMGDWYVIANIPLLKKSLLVLLNHINEFNKEVKITLRLNNYDGLRKHQLMEF